MARGYAFRIEGKMKSVLDKIKGMGTLAIPKSIHTLENVEFVFGPIAGETKDAWLVQCSHAFHPPASLLEIREAEQQLGFPFPSQYRDLLQITNGARLFCVPRKWLEQTSPGAMHIRFELYGCNELVRMNKRIRETFLGAYADDPEYKECRQLNYMAFCNAEDGNFQSLLLEDVLNSQIFLLFHEFSYRPYDMRDAEFCYRISDSLTSWLELIQSSGGWEGRGVLTSGL